MVVPNSFAGILKTLRWLLFVHFIWKCSAATYETDVSALKDIAAALENDLGWTGDPCSNDWRGVTCNSQGVTVIKLTLSSSDLRGTLSPSVGNLTYLQTLDVSFNSDLKGPIPGEIGQLTRLTTLNLQSCAFTGSIPAAIGNLGSLTFLSLRHNQLIGSIPDSLGRLANLTWLDLSENSLSGGLPVSSANNDNVGLDNLTKAEHFHLNNNSFSGSLPKEICSLPELIHLLVDGNSLSGVIPTEIGNFPKLQIMRLDSNMFSGSIPSTISKLSDLTELHLRNNSLTGTFVNISSLQSIQLLAIGMNQFDRNQIPVAMANLTTLQTLEIDSGNLDGEVPIELFNMPVLQSLSLASNQLDGLLNLSNSEKQLSEVNLENNQITSVIGPGNNTDLIYRLANNPVCKDTRYSFSNIICSQNTSGQWTNSNYTCASTCSGDDLNPNSCECSTPFMLTVRFTAPSFLEFDNARFKNLSDQLVEQLKLQTTQVWAKNGSASNYRLYATVQFFPAKGDQSLSDDAKQQLLNSISQHAITIYGFGPYSLDSVVLQSAKSRSRMSRWAIVGICIGAVALIIVASSFAVCAIRQKRRADKEKQARNPFASWTADKDSGTAPQINVARWFFLAEIRKITSNFNEENLIGVGGYGKVYKGQLPTGEIVAIKRAQKGSMQGAEEFKTEIELLSRLHHVNLVGLVGFSYEAGEQILVYEFMSNGTLRDILADRWHGLSWRKRLEIALGSARGIAYLHELANPPVIHRDIKSTNILLDDNFVAKVADFGLSKVTTLMGHVVTAQVKGTMGYLDPEYFATQELTTKSDVYSFGVVLLEIITGRLPIQDGKYIVRDFRVALEQGGMRTMMYLLDPRMRDCPSKDLENYLHLALSCVEEAAFGRPTMNEVVKELEILLSRAPLNDFEPRSNNSSGRFPVPVADVSDAAFQYSGVGLSMNILPK